MKIHQHSSLAALIVTLSAVSGLESTAATGTTPHASPTDMHQLEPSGIEDRISRLSIELQGRSQQLPADVRPQIEASLLAQGFANGDGRDWVNGRRRDWADGSGGDFYNVNRWRNGWSDGGGFVNWYNT